MDSQKENSATVTLYYKGHSILLTDRNSGVDMWELANRQFSLIDKLVLDENVRPSWNIETSKKVKETIDNDPEWVKETDKLSEANPMACEKCGGKTERKTGAYKNKPGTWVGFKCLTDPTHGLTFAH